MTVRTKAQQRAQTTGALLDVARELFARKGFAQVSLGEIVSATGVSKGALYHYFASKDELFRAVLEQVHEEVAERVAAAAPDADAWTEFVAGCVAFVTVTTEPPLRRIMFVDAPSVLGWATWRELDANASMRHLVESLQRLVTEGVIPAQPIAPVAHLLSGAMNEVAAWLATSADPDVDLPEAIAALKRVLGSLRAPT